MGKLPTPKKKCKAAVHVALPAFCLELLTFPSSTLMALINACEKNHEGKVDLVVHVSNYLITNNQIISSNSVHNM